ncbi:MAG: flotillin-like FloA family protein, partial [Phycisphaerae bacterium]|nr:flotillin-like FloA family protein [Phycisphaerae bacterium]
MIASMLAVGPAGWLLGGIIVLAVIVFLSLFGPLFGLWLQALAAKAGVGIRELIGMRFRKVNPQIIVLSRIQAVRAGLDLSTNELESHYL